MNARELVRAMVSVLILVCLLSGFVWADRAEIEEKLSKDIQIQLKDVSVGQALKQIGKKGGVEILLSDEAEWKLPRGAATKVSVVLDGPLGESLTEMLNVFFMRYAVGSEDLTIHPRPELDHILGRPTTKQLELLKAIYTRPIRTYFVDKVQTSINEALGSEVLVSPISVHSQLNSLLRQLVGMSPQPSTSRRRPPRPRNSPPTELVEPVPTEYDLPTPVTLVQLLSQVAIDRQGPEYTKWYIAGMDFPGQNPEIRVLNWSMFAKLKLNQKIDVSYKEVGLDKILQDLASRADVKLIIESNSYLNEYELSASMQNITIEQAVRSIVDMVGAACNVGGGGIEIAGLAAKRRDTPPSKSGTSKTPSKADSEGYVGKISIPMDGGTYYIEFMLREKDLTDELRKLWQEKLKSILQVPTLYDMSEFETAPSSPDPEEGAVVKPAGGTGG